VHAKGWKPQLQGKIADPEFNGDPDWCSLLRLDFGEVMLDLEEGIKIMTEVHDPRRVMELIYRLEEAGIRLKDDDGNWLGHAMTSVFPTGPDFETGMPEARHQTGTHGTWSNHHGESNRRPTLQPAKLDNRRGRQVDPPRT
jgi:hypothetical protein